MMLLVNTVDSQPKRKVQEIALTNQGRQTRNGQQQWFSKDKELLEVSLTEVIYKVWIDLITTEHFLVQRRIRLSTLSLILSKMGLRQMKT